jgi:hypothetical protein
MNAFLVAAVPDPELDPSAFAHDGRSPHEYQRGGLNSLYMEFY